MATVFNSLQILPGVQSSTDETPQATQHYVSSQSIRFWNGKPEKIGGWQYFNPTGNTPIIGTPRNLYSFILANVVRFLLGTNTSLYSYIGQSLVNVTPVLTSGTALTTPFATYYGTLGANPITTIINTGTLTFADTATRVIAGDPIKISGASTTNGISSTLINALQTVISTTANSFTISVPGLATSSGSGGGASVVRATSIVRVTQTANGYFNGENVEFSGVVQSPNIGGIPTADFNSFFQIRNVATNSYDIVLPTIATSSATSQGGSGVTVFPQIPVGLASATIGSGYGMGLYGVGLYGTDLPASTPTPPRIWSFDRFGQDVVLTPGDQLGLYLWDGTLNTLPTIVTNAPTAINYTYVDNNIINVLGAGGVGNLVSWSDQGNATVWTPNQINQAGSQTIYGADTFISQVPIQGANLLFTKTRCYIQRYINQPFIYQFTFLDLKGLIARDARISIGGVVYWMGPDNWYMYNGGNVVPIPSNSTPESTIKKYVYDNLSTSQQDKVFCWYNKKFNEIWWHWPSTMATEPDMVARLNLNDFSWCYDQMQRSCAEYPTPLQLYPYAVDQLANIYQHENGFDDTVNPLEFSLETRYVTEGEYNTELLGLIPDSIQTTGNITVSLNVKQYPQSSVTITPQSPITATPTTEILQFRSQQRYRQYLIEGAALGQFWRAGDWKEWLQQGTER